MNLQLNKEITTQEILQIGNKLKNNKAVGFDNISNELIKVFINHNPITTGRGHKVPGGKYDPM